MLLEDFNYFFNKAINQYINKRYNIYDVNQQTTDDLRVLKATAILVPQLVGQEEEPSSDHAAKKAMAEVPKASGYPNSHKVKLQGIEIENWRAGHAALFGATYEVYLPLDYLHMLNCICIYKLNKRFKCYNKDDYVQFAAKRLTADAWSVVLNDFYNRPLPERPYYYIHNINQSLDLPTNPVKYPTEDSGHDLITNLPGTDAAKDYSVTPGTGDTLAVSGNGSNLPRTIKFNNGITNKSVVEKEAGARYGNASSVRCEIRYGKKLSIN